MGIRDAASEHSAAWMPVHEEPPERVEYWQRLLGIKGPNSAARTPVNMWPASQVRRQPVAILDRNKDLVTDTEAAQIRHQGIQTLLDASTDLRQLAVGLTWDRSPEERMKEYKLLEQGAKCINILKAMNTMDRDALRGEGKRKRMEVVSGALKAIKYMVGWEEMARTSNDMRELLKRGCRAERVEDCMGRIVDGINMSYSHGKPGFVYTMEQEEWIMDQARSTVLKLRAADSYGGHWAVEILNFYSARWLVWLDEVYWHVHDLYPAVFDEKMDEASKRAEIVWEIVTEVGREGKSEISR